MDFCKWGNTLKSFKTEGSCEYCEGACAAKVRPITLLKRIEVKFDIATRKILNYTMADPETDIPCRSEKGGSVLGL